MKKLLSKAFRFVLRVIDKEAFIDEMRDQAKKSDNDLDDWFVDIAELKFRADSTPSADKVAKSLGEKAVGELDLYVGELKKKGVSRLMDKLF